MGQYSEAAEFYDLLYLGMKDFAREAQFLANLIRGAHSTAIHLLDVGCGTGEHARQFATLGFAVDGVDVEPAFVDLARMKWRRSVDAVGTALRMRIGEPGVCT